MKAGYDKKLEERSRRSAREVIIEDVDGQPSPREIQRIWRVNPSYTHTSSTISIARIVLIVAMGTFFIGAMYLLDSSLQTAIIMGISFICAFIFVFYDYSDLVKNLFHSN